jgi:hypothetical protein
MTRSAQLQQQLFPPALDRKSWNRFQEKTAQAIIHRNIYSSGKNGREVAGQPYRRPSISLPVARCSVASSILWSYPLIAGTVTWTVGVALLRLGALLSTSLCARPVPMTLPFLCLCHAPGLGLLPFSPGCQSWPGQG